jgi:hypothetical protein
MKIDPKLVEQWLREWTDLPDWNQIDGWNYIAQRAADHALEEAAKTCERFGKSQEVEIGAYCAEAIRALKEKP